MDAPFDTASNAGRQGKGQERADQSAPALTEQAREQGERRQGGGDVRDPGQRVVGGRHGERAERCKVKQSSEICEAGRVEL